MPGFDSSKVKRMDSNFSGQFIEDIDFTYLKTDNVISMNGIFSSSSKLTFLDLSKFNTSKLQNMRNMFYNNMELKEIDLSSFDTSNVNKCEYLINYYQKTLVFKISNKFTNCKEFIPIELKIINVDELSCKNFEHCKECIGSKETLSCNDCEFGYELKDNKCILANCIMGENEKCHNCDFQTINECLSCNKGYYLPINNKNKTICTKCKIDGCETCYTIIGNCQKYQSFYKPIFDEYNSTIISCKKMCELGEKNKCLSCDGKEENRCLTCNIGYKLMKNGECKKIENHL